jgi:membrane protein YqaA with SNARE-associated domain
MASPIVGMFGSESLQSYFNVSETTGIYLAGIATTIAVATIGAAGTAIANLNEYHIFTFLLRYGKVHRVRQTRFFATARRWFSVSPFGLVALFSFLPIPVDVVRWLAISCRYSRLRYAGANFAGRFLRYGLLAGAATCLAIGWRGILGIQIGLAALVIIRYLPRLVTKRKNGRHSLPYENNKMTNDESMTNNE